MTDPEKDLRDRLARLQSLLDQLDSEAERMREFHRHTQRLSRMQRRETRH